MAESESVRYLESEVEQLRRERDEARAELARLRQLPPVRAVVLDPGSEADAADLARAISAARIDGHALLPQRWCEQLAPGVLRRLAELRAPDTTAADPPRVDRGGATAAEEAYRDSAPVHCTAAQPCEQAGPGFCVCPSVAEPARDCGVAAHRQAAEPIESLVERSSLGTPEARAARESVPEDTARAIADRVRERPAGQELPVALAGAMHRAMCELDRTALTPSSTTVAVMAEYLIARGWPASLRVRDDEGGQQ